MCLLIENSQTKEYLTSAGKWSKYPLEGEVFLSINVAMKAVSHSTIKNFNIVFLDSHANQYLKLIYR